MADNNYAPHKETPLMQQYSNIKNEYPGAIILFRVGDFYEMFGQDAVVSSKILNIALSKRSNGAAADVELAGFPHHSLDSYLPKLVKAGYRVAICDQLENPKEVKGLIKRGVTEVVTPGLCYTDSVLDQKQNNYLASIFMQKSKIGIAFLDISTGEFSLSEGNQHSIKKLLEAYQPSEIVICRKQKLFFDENISYNSSLYMIDEWVYNQDYAEKILKLKFNATSLRGFGIDNNSAGIMAAAAIIRYLEINQQRNISHIQPISYIQDDKYLWMDNFTITSLELLFPQKSGGASLINIIDETKTPMGARLLRKWLAFPLKDLSLINLRLDAVETLVKNSELRAELIILLKNISDLERLSVKLSTLRINPREFIVLKNSLSRIDPIKNLLSQLSGSLLNFHTQLPAFQSLISLISHTLHDPAPLSLAQGGVIKLGVNSDLDNLRHLAASGKESLESILKTEIANTKITNLKIGYNKVYGFYLEVTNSYKDKVPANWIRKQTLTNAERYISEDLKQYESAILNAEEKSLALEYELFYDLLNSSLDYVEQIQYASNIISQLDCLISFAEIASRSNFSKSSVNDSKNIDIVDARHPVIEKIMPPSESYIPNNISLLPSEQQIIIVTGPNMAGKSAILRQTALIVILAQVGSFVPAKSASIGIVDKIFTRVGASDNISKGESTFMTEMIETASIMNNFTDRSLILMDEIGRGTSTFDGISLAWAIVEHLHNHESMAPKTLFATHYHELNDIADKLPRVKNFNVSIKQINNQILFLRKLQPGGSSHSFGINVATMAGMPIDIVSRAKEILLFLEEHRLNSHSKPVMTDIQLKKYKLSFHEIDPHYLKVKNEILSLNIDTITPIEAILKLNELKRLLTTNIDL